MADAPELEPVESRLAVDLSISTERIKRELATRVPVLLAQERARPIGGAGRVSYVARRSDFSFSLDAERLVVTTDVSTQVRVCKPFGPFCPVYGSCQPSFRARASVPLVPSPEYELGQSHARVTVTRSCVIAVYDASAELHRIARQQSQQIRAQIDSALPPLRPHVEELWQQLHEPLQLAAGGCLRITPQQLAQSRPRLHDGRLSTRVGLRAQLALDPACDELAEPVAARPLPPLEINDDLPGGAALRTTLHTDWRDVSAQLNRSLAEHATTARRPSALEPLRVEARGAVLDQQPVVELKLRLARPGCGNVRLVGKPQYDSKHQRIRLRRLRLVTGDYSAAALQEARQLAATLEQLTAVVVPADFRAAAAQIEPALQRLTQAFPPDVSLLLDLKAPRIERVVPTGSGLVAIARLDADVRLSAD